MKLEIFMIKLVQPIPVHIKLSTNKVEITRLDNKKTISRLAHKKFSNDRLVLADFENAEFLIRSVLNELYPVKSFLRRSYNIVIQQMEKMEGGLSDLEKRALKEMAGLVGGSMVKVIEHSRKLTLREALAEAGIKE